MERKIYVLLLIFILSFSTIVIPSQKGHAAAVFEPSVETAMLVDVETGKILYQQNTDIPLPPASMTKMMSEYLILEAINEGTIHWDDIVPINDYLATMSHNSGLSNVMLNTSEEYTVLELYESIAIYSANASTMALAELIAGSEGAFVEMMNEKAEELGMGESLKTAGEAYGLTNLEEIAAEELGDFQFVNSTGLPNSLLDGNHPEGTEADEDNWMTAEATAKLAYYLVSDYPEVLEAAGIPLKIFREGTPYEITMQNWNWMIPGSQQPELDYAPIEGLKTGFTNAAGYCFAGSAEKDGMRLISVVMGAESEAHRFTETERLMEWGFDSFVEVELTEENMTVNGHSTLPVIKGVEEEVAIASTDGVTALMLEEEAEQYSYEVVYDEDLLTEDGELEAPVESGQVIGQLVVNYDGENPISYIDGRSNSLAVDMVTTESVERSSWISLTFQSIGHFFSNLWTSAVETVKGWL